MISSTHFGGWLASPGDAGELSGHPLFDLDLGALLDEWGLRGHVDGQLGLPGPKRPASVHDHLAFKLSVVIDFDLLDVKVPVA